MLPLRRQGGTASRLSAPAWAGAALCAYRVGRFEDAPLCPTTLDKKPICRTAEAGACAGRRPMQRSAGSMSRGRSSPRSRRSAWLRTQKGPARAGPSVMSTWAGMPTPRISSPCGYFASPVARGRVHEEAVLTSQFDTVRRTPWLARAFQRSYGQDVPMSIEKKDGSSASGRAERSRSCGRLPSPAYRG